MPPEGDNTGTTTKPKPADQAPEKPKDRAPTTPFHKDLPEIHGPSTPAAKTGDAAPKTPVPDDRSMHQIVAKAIQVARPGEATKPTDTTPPATTPPAAAPEAKPKLSQDVIDKKAEELHTAITKRGWLGSKPDKDGITQALSGTTEADRKAIEAAYQKNFGKGQPDSLRNDLRSKLEPEDFRRAESTLNTHDGRTNDAGNLMTAMEQAKHDKDAGSNQVRAILQSLDSKTLEQVKADFKKDYGQDLTDALGKANVNDTTKSEIPYLLKGIDKTSSDDIQKMAHFALENGDKRAFCEAIRGDSPEAKDARTKLLAEPGMHERLQNQFFNAAGMGDEYSRPDPKDWQKGVDPIVNDYLNDGKISLKTIAGANTPGWPFDNIGNTALAAKNATDSERHQFLEGKQLTDSNATNLTAEQKAAKDYYTQLHEAFGRAGTAREASTLEDQLIHGRETVVTDMANTHSDGYTGLHMFGGHNKQDLINRAENLSKEDWAQLSTKPQGNETAADALKRSAEFKKEIDQSLSTYADPGEKDRIMKMMELKSNAESYEASQQIKRSLAEVMTDATSKGWLGGTNYDTKTIVGKLNNLTQSDVDQYNNPKPPAPNAFRTNLDQFVGANLKGAEQLEAQRLLAKANDTGKPPVADPVDNFLMAKVNGAEPVALVGLAEKALADPAVRERLNQPADKLSPADKELKAQIENATMLLEMKNTPPSYEGAYVPNSGPTSEDLNKALFKDGHIPAETKLDMGFPRKDVLSDLPSAPQAERDAAAKYLTAEEKQVIEQASQNPDHKLSLADRMRLAAVDSKGAPTNTNDIAAELGKLTNEQKIALKNEYGSKYGHGDLDTDYAKSLDNDAERLKFRQLLATTTGDGRQNYYDNYAAMIKSESGLSPDGSKLTMERANDIYATSIQEYQRIYKTLPPEKQQALDKYFGESMEQYKDSKQKLAEIAVDAAITAAALAAAPFTAGMSTVALMSTAAAFGATFRVAAMAAIEGNDFDSSGKNIAKQMVIGGTSAALNFFGGTGAMAAVEQGGQVLAKEGAINAAKLLAKEAVENGFIGASSNVISDLVVAPFNKDGIDVQQLERSALTGLVAGSVLPIAFKGVGAAYGASKDLIVNLTREVDGLHINPKNLVEPVSFKNTKTGEIMHFKPGEGESVKLGKDWLPTEVAAASTAAAAAPVVAEVIKPPVPPTTPEVPIAPPPVPPANQQVATNNPNPNGNQPGKNGEVPTTQPHPDHAPLGLASAETTIPAAKPTKVPEGGETRTTPEVTQPPVKTETGTRTPPLPEREPGTLPAPEGPTTRPDRAPEESSKPRPETLERQAGDVPPPPPPHVVNDGETVTINGKNGTKATANGPEATIHVQPETPGSTVHDLDIKLNSGAKAVVNEGTGKISGSGIVEVSGNRSSLEVSVPEGKTLRLVLKEGSPDIHVAPGSKGKIEVVRENGLDLPEGLRQYRDATRLEGKVEILERHEAGLRPGEKVETKPFSLESSQARTAELEQLLKKQSESISRDQWRDMFDGVHDMHDGGPPRKWTTEERKLAIEVMQQSSSNMNSRAVDSQMKELGKTLTPPPAKGEKVIVYTTDGSSDGNALAHIFSKNNRETEIEIRQLTATEIESIKAKVAKVQEVQTKFNEAKAQEDELKRQLKDPAVTNKREVSAQLKTAIEEKVKLDLELRGKNGKGGLLGEVQNNTLVFDDLSHMSPEQRQALGLLSSVKPVTNADLGFSRGMNMYDFAVTSMTHDASSMNGKMADIVNGAQAIKKAHPELTDREAVSRYLKEGNANAIENPGAHLKQLAEDPAIAKRSEILQAMGGDETQVIDQLYNHATEPLVTKEQMNEYLANIARDVERTNALRRERGLEPLQGKPEDYQDAALKSLEQNAHFNDYGTMAKQAASVDNVLKSRLAAEGLGPNDYLVVTGLESDGSGYLANTLYAKANGLPPERFISMDRLRELAKNPEEAEKLLGHKKLVFLEDYRNSGRQQAELLADAQDKVLSHLVGQDGKPLVKGIVAANFGSHELPAGTGNPFTVFGEGKLFNAEPHSTAIAPPGALTVESISGDHYVSLGDYSIMARRGTDGSLDYYKDMGSGSLYNQSSVSTGIFTPYGTPNNNPRYLSNAERYFGLPVRYPDHVYELFTRPKVARPVTEAGPHTFHGGASEDANAFGQMVKDADADVVIDLRGADPKDFREQKAIAAEKEWAANNPGKRPQTENIPIPTELPAAGSVEYDAMLEQMHQFEGLVQGARAEGKNVFYHCAWGQDRTGMMQAFDQVINQGKSVDEALKNWAALKDGNIDQSFLALYQPEKFRQMMEDYRNKYPN